MTNSTSQNDLAWMLDDLVRVPSVVYAVVLSTDGLVIQKSTTLPADAADVLAAGASSLHSVAAGMGRRFDGGVVQQVIIEFTGQTMFIAAAGMNARLAVLCEQSVDMGTVAYEMSRLVTRLGEYLGAEARANL
ncbi:roadblock/LC7 domain-containing protein [Micromonospora sp. SL1-18]|uniref:roadblock/LC7 domain-containing protein n=1 Tax=Micromonospora sp. SL1-18 TaxID=3399128 RepID=UPI003A4D6074